MTAEWYYANKNRRTGPVTRAEIDQLVEQGTITAATLVWGEGMADWAPASEILRVSDTLLSTAFADDRGPIALPEPGLRRAVEKALPTQRAEPKPETITPSGGSSNSASPWGGLSKGGSRQWDGNSFDEPAFEDSAPSMQESGTATPAPAPKRPRGEVPRNITGRASWFSAVTHVLRNFANFRGRDVRWQFWYAVLAATIVGIGLNGADLNQEQIRIDQFSIWPTQIYWLVVALPLLASLVRRLHDVGMTGLLAVLIIVPAIGILILAVLAMMRTQEGENVFGPEPRIG